MSRIQIAHPTRKIKATIPISGSKSESNRLLIIQQLAKHPISLHNLSTARDTQQLICNLQSSEQTIDVLDAGTSMRFLTAYFCATNQHKILTGTHRMLERPIVPLVDALRQLGFELNYLNQEGFAPLEIVPINQPITKKEVHIVGNISSQFITALLLIAPSLFNGLKLHFTTTVSSQSYIEMTLKLMSYFGVQAEWIDDSIAILPQPYKAKEYIVGGDWSSASYWYSIAALADEAEIILEGLKLNSFQGDKIIAEWMLNFGVETVELQEGVLIRKTDDPLKEHLHFDCTNHPDLAQTIAVLATATNRTCELTGVESLRIKETDRIAALQNELRKCGVEMKENRGGVFQISGIFISPEEPIETYNDHRMAMAFAPLAVLKEVTIQNPEVVQKSYPEFWGAIERAGFQLNLE